MTHILFPITTDGNLRGMAEPPNDLLRQEREVEEMLQSVSPEVMGARLARARVRAGLSIRELAAAANVNKNSIVRLEKGGAPQAVTVLKLCAAMGLHLASLAKPSLNESAIVAIHRRDDDRWYDLTDFGAGPVADKPLSPTERLRLVKKGMSSPMLMLTCRLESGQIMPNVLEVYERTEVRSHVGEEMVYVLEGKAQVDVGSESFELEQGECATFWSSEPHSYAPAPGSPAPVRLLSVSIQRPKDRNEPGV